MNEYRKDFPFLNKNYIYFNNASTSLKPKIVIDAIVDYYSNYSVNTNRGIDSLGYEVTQKYEKTRKIVAQFLGCLEEEIIFTRGTTESINLVAHSLGDKIVEKGDEIIISDQEHHSNLIPWQELCKEKGAILKFVKTDKNGVVSFENLKSILNDKTKIVALNHVSNVMGSINNLKKISKIIKQSNAFFIVDGAQGVIHEKVDVKELNIDFYAFSSHKMYGPMGVGVLYGKKELLNIMKPIHFGGEMVDEVQRQISTYKDVPYKFEAGTMMVPEVIGLGVAIEYINSIGLDKINDYIKQLRKYLISKLENEVEGIKIYNKDNINSNLITFNINNIHAHDVATYLDKNKIIVRAGQHCAQLAINKLNTNATVRISLAFYNTKKECDKIVEVLKKVGDYIDVLF